jgi:TRAP-type C4-dicarboxylate transport system substrate-binding protein
MLGAAALTGAAALVLSACAGSIGGGSGGAGGGEGFEYGASQEEVDAVLEGLEPVTLTFQPGAASAESIMSPAATEIADRIEERSGGMITVDLVWGQAVAGYDTVQDALADGRLDLANTLPGYSPAEFAAFDDLSTTTAMLPSSPFAGEFIAYAVYSDLGWENQEILDSFDAAGLVPLTPFATTAGNYTTCREPLASAADWQGRQVRVGTTAQDTQVSGLGAVPVSMEYTEMFEALERGTVDCNVGPSPATAESGVLEVAPELGFTTTTSFPRTATTVMAGSRFEELPLAYQQIVFDSAGLGGGGFVQSYTDSAAELVRQSKEHGGEVRPLSEDTQSRLRTLSEELTAEAVSGGRLGEDFEERLAERIEAWTAKVEELGLADSGDMADFDEWYGEADYAEFARAVYESGAALEHRPGA